MKLGDMGRDRTSGYTGVVVARTDWLNGCVRLGVQSKGLTKDEKPHDVQWFDINDVEPVPEREAMEARPEPPGGPMPDPGRC